MKKAELKKKIREHKGGVYVDVYSKEDAYEVRVAKKELYDIIDRDGAGDYTDFGCIIIGSEDRLVMTATGGIHHAD